jgi:threonine synthase
MELYSTNDNSKQYSLKEAVLLGLPEDNGLFMPVHIPMVSQTFLDKIQDLSFKEIAFEVANKFLADELNSATLADLIDQVFNFAVPVVPVTEHIYCLELFHGPTLAFKDFGARFMAALMSHLLEGETNKPCILVATSGDTGSAVAQGFFQIPGIDVVILYPSGKVSEIQEKQLTTIGSNVTALEIQGTFDDCQRLVKTAFLDQDLKHHKNLTSANSINIARLLPQCFYYFQVYAKLKHLQKPIVCSVPSGNFGNLMGGLLAKRMGLPIDKFVASNNENKVFYQYLQSGVFNPVSSVETISNAMDVGNPSNFARVMELYHHNLDELSKHVIGFTFSDDQTKAAIKKVYSETGYLMDPHGAVGYLGLMEFIKIDPNIVGVFLGTAHPAKFLDVVRSLVPDDIQIPARLRQVLGRTKNSVLLSSDYQQFKEYLSSN